MSRATAAASADRPMGLDSGALEDVLDGVDDIVVPDSESQPEQEPDGEGDGDEEPGAPDESGAEAEQGEDDATDGDLAELKRKLATERRAKKELKKRLDAIERRTAAVEQGTAQHLRAMRDTRADEILGQAKSQVAQLASRVQAAQQARREARESGDLDKEMQAEEAWLQARDRLAVARQQITQLERQAAAIKQQPVNVAAQPSAKAVEDEAAALASEWLGRHAWVAQKGNEAEQAIVRRQSEMLVKNGIPQNTPEHWVALTDQMKILLPHRMQTKARNGAPPMAQPSQRGTAGAPRAPAGNGKTGGNAITRAEVEAWRLGRNYDIVNNPEHRKEFLRQRDQSRKTRDTIHG